MTKILWRLLPYLAVAAVALVLGAIGYAYHVGGISAQVDGLQDAIERQAEVAESTAALNRRLSELATETARTITRLELENSQQKQQFVELLAQAMPAETDNASCKLPAGVMQRLRQAAAATRAGSD